MTISGNVGMGQRFDFADETGLLTLRNLEGFTGSLGFTELGRGAHRPGRTPGPVRLRRRDPSGPQPLFGARAAGQPAGQHRDRTASMPDAWARCAFDLATDDFVLGSDGAGGTLLTYAPPNGIDLAAVAAERNRGFRRLDGDVRRASCRIPSAPPIQGSPASRCCRPSRSRTAPSTSDTGSRPTSRRNGS